LEDGIARMGEIVFSNGDRRELRALGLGSCIGLCLYDPLLKLGCIAHIMLPQARSASTPDVGKYADTAVPHVVHEMTSRGAVKSRLRTAIVGGAQLFSFQSAGDKLDVGKRNIEAVKRHLAESRLPLAAEDTGGKCGRTITLDCASGCLTVKSAGGADVSLANLAS